MAENEPPDASNTTNNNTTVTSRLRSSSNRIRSTSISMGKDLLSFNPQPGMWAATGTAIAYAPTLSELREPYAGGSNIEFTDHGHSARTVIVSGGDENELRLGTRRVSNATILGQYRFPGGDGDGGGGGGAGEVKKEDTIKEENRGGVIREEEKPSLAELTKASEEEKHGWGMAVMHGLQAFWKFFKTPTGFLMTLYGLNIVAWGAMLFFLLLKAAPAMDHPSADADSSPRKIWIEIDSQILNALFCVTGFGLAPWRFRDLYCLAAARFHHRYTCMKVLADQNKAWFRPPAWYVEAAAEETAEDGLGSGGISKTFTGEKAPPTPLWKLSFVVWMMAFNTFFQACLAAFMWAYNRINRPSWATGTFIALGCGVSLAAGLMMWWEGRRVKKIEGPIIKVIEAEDKEGDLDNSPEGTTSGR